VQCCLPAHLRFRDPREVQPRGWLVTVAWAWVAVAEAAAASRSTAEELAPSAEPRPVGRCQRRSRCLGCAMVAAFGRSCQLPAAAGPAARPARRLGCREWTRSAEPSSAGRTGEPRKGRVSERAFCGVSPHRAHTTRQAAGVARSWRLELALKRAPLRTALADSRQALACSSEPHRRARRIGGHRPARPAGHGAPVLRCLFTRISP